MLLHLDRQWVCLSACFILDLAADVSDTRDVSVEAAQLSDGAGGEKWVLARKGMQRLMLCSLRSYRTQSTLLTFVVCLVPESQLTLFMTSIIMFRQEGEVQRVYVRQRALNARALK